MSNAEHVHPPEDAITLSAVLQALADPLRLSIVRMIADNGSAMNCGDLSFGRPRSSMSHHFRILREAGIICTTTHSVEHMNSLRREALDRQLPGLMAAILGENAPDPAPSSTQQGPA